MISSGVPSGAIALLSHPAYASRMPPSRMLTQALREIGRTADWRRVLQESSMVREGSLNLARYLTLFLPCIDGQRSLLGEALNRALDAWHGHNVTVEDRYFAYLRGLLVPLPQVFEWTVQIRGAHGEALWDPMAATLWDCWRESRGTVEVARRQRPQDSTYVDVVGADFRFLVLVRFLARRSLRLAPLASRWDELVCRYG